MTTKNETIIRDVYAAFGRGDVGAILSRVTEDTSWTFAVRDSEVPWHQPFRGKAALPGFFGALMEGVAIEGFEPYAILTAGDHVIARVRIAYSVRKNARRVEQEQLHFWTLDTSGKVLSLVHYEDTAQVLGAFRAAS